MINELKEDTNKQLNELSKTMQDIKDDFSKESNRNPGNEKLHYSNKKIRLKVSVVGRRIRRNNFRA